MKYSAQNNNRAVKTDSHGRIITGETNDAVRTSSGQICLR